MTPLQIIVLVVFGIPALIALTRLIWSIRFKEQPFGFLDFLILGVSTIVILVVFLGIK